MRNNPPAGPGGPNGFDEKYDPSPGDSQVDDYAWQAQPATNNLNDPEAIMGTTVTKVVVFGTPVPSPLPGQHDKMTTTCAACGATMVFAKNSTLVRCHNCQKVAQMASTKTMAPARPPVPPWGGPQGTGNRWGF